ncbi:MAG TPA: hypothetical protein VKB34_07960 [Povalibacter sp.]|nr:hypothetical protein [Povalibacter sp.]
MKTNYWKSLGLTGLALMAVAATAAAAGPPASSYDNFKSGHLDPSKWTSAPFGQCNQLTTLECVRAITLPRTLELGIRTLGSNATDSGRTYDTSFIQFRNPASINSMAVDVRIPIAASVSCPVNTGDRSYSHFLLTGGFFNTGSSPDFWGDLDAYVLIDTNNPGGKPVAGAFLGSNNTFFGNVVLGNVAPGEPVRISMRWDQPGSQFVFSLTHLLTGQQSIASIPYAQTVAGPAAQAFREMGTRNFVANCTATPTSAQMDAFVSNVQVNSPSIP